MTRLILTFFFSVGEDRWNQRRPIGLNRTGKPTQISPKLRQTVDRMFFCCFQRYGHCDRWPRLYDPPPSIWRALLLGLQRRCSLFTDWYEPCYSRRRRKFYVGLQGCNIFFWAQIHWRSANTRYICDVNVGIAC